LKKLIFVPFAIAAVLACSALGEKWETITEAGITVEMPGKPQKQSQSVPTGTGTASGQLLTVDKGAEAYILAYHEFPAAVSNLNLDPRVILKGASEGAVRNIDGNVTSQREVMSGPYAGTEIIGNGLKEGKEIEFSIRLYWAKPRLIQTLYVNEKGKGNTANATRFLDSLKIS
jgi:hypothetical protein